MCVCVYWNWVYLAYSFLFCLAFLQAISHIINTSDSLFLSFQSSPFHRIPFCFSKRDEESPCFTLVCGLCGLLCLGSRKWQTDRGWQWMAGRPLYLLRWHWSRRLQLWHDSISNLSQQTDSRQVFLKSKEMQKAKSKKKKKKTICSTNHHLCRVGIFYWSKILLFDDDDVDECFAPSWTLSSCQPKVFQQLSCVWPLLWDSLCQFALPAESLQDSHEPICHRPSHWSLPLLRKWKVRPQRYIYIYALDIYITCFCILFLTSEDTDLVSIYQSSWCCSDTVHFDLSSQAFSAIARPEAGAIITKYRPVICPLSVWTTSSFSESHNS